MKKKVIALILITALVMSFIGCGGATTTIPPKKTVEEFTSYDEIYEEYIFNMDDLTAKNQIKQVDNVTLDTIKEYASTSATKVREFNLDALKSTDCIQYIASLDDLSSNIDNKIHEELLDYIIDITDKDDVKIGENDLEMIYIIRVAEKYADKKHKDLYEEDKELAKGYKKLYNTLGDIKEDIINDIKGA